MYKIILLLLVLCSCLQEDLSMNKDASIKDMATDSSSRVIDLETIPDLSQSRLITMISDGGLPYLYDTKLRCSCEFKGDYCIPINKLTWTAYMFAECKGSGVLISERNEDCGYYPLINKYVKYVRYSRMVWTMYGSECREEVKITLISDSLEEINELDLYKKE